MDGRHVEQTAVVRLDPERGRFAVVPAAFFRADGKTTVTFTRNSDSIQAVVKHAPIFADPAGRWARADVEQLALRKKSAA